MPPMPQREVAFWAKGARKRAQSLTRDPALWEAKIDELERLSKGNGAAVQWLIELMCAYARAEREGWLEEARIGVEGGDPLDRPPISLPSDLILLAHNALVSRGLEATNALLRAYESADPDTPEKEWILRPLADIGDPETGRFFQDLKVEDITLSLHFWDQAAKRCCTCCSMTPLLACWTDHPSRLL